MIFGTMEQRLERLKMNTKRCDICNELYDGSHVCKVNPCKELFKEDPITLAIIARQEVELERLRVSNKQLKEALFAAVKALDAAKDAIHTALPYGSHF